MKFIKPNEISSKIMTLIEESDEFIIIVSPYVKISKWFKLLKKLDKLDERNVSIEFIIRNDTNNTNSFEELEQLNIKYTAIKDLHCKLYLNEKYAIVSSMNLLLYSEINSIELAYQTESETELNELKDFCIRYLQINIPDKFGSKAEISSNLLDHICNTIYKYLGRNLRAQLDNGSLLLNTGSNNYSAHIYNNKQNILRVSGILSRKEYDVLDKYPQNMIKVEGIKFELNIGGHGHYDTLWGSLDTPLRSSDFNSVYDVEKSIIAEKISEFIVEIEKFKEGVDFQV